MSQSGKNSSGGGGGGSAPKRSAEADGLAESASKRRSTEAAPAPVAALGKLGKISMSFGAKKPAAPAAPAAPPPVKGISMKLGAKPAATTAPVAALKPKSRLAARAFGDADSGSDEEEMPPEAKMRMKNIGRETPTSAGPNSFGKTKIGFCDSKKKRDRDLEESLAADS